MKGESILAALLSILFGILAYYSIQPGDWLFVSKLVSAAAVGGMTFVACLGGVLLGYSLP